MRAKVGYFNSATTTGNQSVIGVGFKPDLVIFLGSANSISGGSVVSPENDGRFFFGAATATDQWAGSYYNGYAGMGMKPEVSVQTINTTLCITQQSAAIAGPLLAASRVSLDDDGFTVNWTLAPAVSRDIHYVAIADNNPIKIGTFTPPTSLGVQSVTGVGFQPTVTMAVCFDDNNSYFRRFAWGFGHVGMVANNAKAWMMGARNQNSATSSTEVRWEYAPFPNVFLYGQTVASFTSHDVDGFSYNIIKNPGGFPPVHGYICFSGDVDIVRTQGPFTDGTYSVTGIGFKPALILLAKNDHSAGGLRSCGGLDVADETASLGCHLVQQHGITSNYSVSYATRSSMIVDKEAVSPCDISASIISLNDDGYTVLGAGLGVQVRGVDFFALGPSDDASSSLCAMGVG